jgi:phospholipase A-2-activating protein
MPLDRSCKDQLIRIFDKHHLLVGTLKGHTNAVTSLSILELPVNTTSTNTSSKNKHVLVSGSWDGTAKLWDIATHECIATLTGHENAVSVQSLPPSDADNKARLATGSAGIAQGGTITQHKIRLWEISMVDNVNNVNVNVNVNVKAELKHTIAQDHNVPLEVWHMIQRVKCC